MLNEPVMSASISPLTDAIAEEKPGRVYLETPPRYPHLVSAFRTTYTNKHFRPPASLRADFSAPKGSVRLENRITAATNLAYSLLASPMPTIGIHATGLKHLPCPLFGDPKPLSDSL
jgi:hypothetical protein